jgi:checkpoint serine/threonine-protein kinase
MAIFADGDAPAKEAEGGVWQDFGTRDERRKENVVEATPWKGETMPQSAKKPLAPRTPKMEIFKDTVRNRSHSQRLLAPETRLTCRPTTRLVLHGQRMIFSAKADRSLPMPT